MQYILGQVMVIIASIAAWLILALAILLLVKIFKGNSTYKKALSIVGYAFLIKAVAIVIGTVIILITKDIYSADLSLYRVLKSVVSNPYLKTILQNITIFRIWEYAVIGIGVYLMSGLSKAKTAVIVTIPFIVSFLFSLLQVFIASLSHVAQ